MQNRKSLSLQIAGAVALATLFGTSAFAESRHQQRTNHGSGGSGGRIDRSGSSRSNGSRQQHFEQRNNNRGSNRSVDRGSDRSRDRGTWRNDSQRGNDTQRNRDSQRYESRNNTQRYDSRQQSDRNRNNNNNGSWRPESRVAPSRGQSYNGYGRVDRYVRDRNGYRVWMRGGLYPIFVPFDHWRRNPLRVGLYIRFGGFWDPLGYWSVNDYSPYNDGYYGGGGYGGGYGDVYTRSEIRGVVESVDYRRGTLVLNDDISRQFVTVTLPRDRRLDDVRAGDYVDFSGDWTRNGVFNAYRLERIDEGRDNNRDNNRY